MESFNLNIIPGKDRPVCHASQYDIGRTIRVNLFEGFNVFTLDGTEVISISVRKPDGNVVTESVTNTSDSYVEFVTTEQMTACHGSNLCELKLEKGADVIGTMNFILEVEQDPLEGGIASQSEIDNLQTQVAGMVATEVADQYDSANVIFDAAPTPGHGNGYAVTSEGVATEISTLNAAIALKQDATDANLQTTDTTIVGAINELNTDKQDKLSNSDIPITVLSPSVSDVTLKCTRYGNVACITGYFRTTASISANSGIFGGFPNPVVPSGDTNLYFVFLNETDGSLMRFRINRNYCEFKNPVALASGKTFVGTMTYICD